MLNAYLTLIEGEQNKKISVLPEIDKITSSLGIPNCENAEDALKIIKYILLRSEEQDVVHLDKYGRFNRGNSILAKLNFDNRPIIDELLLEIVNQLGLNKINFWPDNKRAAVCLTHDVDAFDGTSYLFFRQGLWFANSLKNLCFLNVEASKSHIQKIIRWSQFKKAGKDPMHAFEKWIELENSYGYRSTFFFMSLKRTISREGRRYAMENPYLKKVINILNSGGWEIGLHAARFNHLDVNYLKEQKKYLEDILGKEIIGCRHHWLKVRFPESWSLYRDTGLKYSSNMGWDMGFNGFRAGTCIPYNPLSINSNSKVDFLEIPFQLMDAQQIQNVGEYTNLFKEYLEKVKNIGGCLVIDFHQEYFDEQEAPGVNTVYKEILRILSQDKEIFVCKLEDVYSYLTRNK